VPFDFTTDVIYEEKGSTMKRMVKSMDKNYFESLVCTVDVHNNN